ncbi:MAG: Gfo/Idh/MocA family oxidoreductase [Filimonas sp.]|nr:Gfo/Idh/MocA family oxidoreductase [Filimonas sp.]
MAQNVAIIGAGQLGTRHLQGLKSAKLAMNIYVVDNSDNSLDLAKLRYSEVPENEYEKTITYVKQLGELPPHLELVIVATSSAPRSLIFNELIKGKKIKFLVFEKFLFQTIAEYDEVSNKLREKSIQCWVNCTRRMFPHYLELKNILSGEDVLAFEVLGSNWGLACNSIHYIDLFAFLTGEQFIEYDLTRLNNEIYSSKRAGYIEFNGTILGKSENGCRLNLLCEIDEKVSVIIRITTKNFFIEINEATGVAFLLSDNEKKDIKVSSLYQSQLTGLLAESLLNNLTCNLPTYQESAALHKQILLPFLEKYNELAGTASHVCPIT